MITILELCDITRRQNLKDCLFLAFSWILEMFWLCSFSISSFLVFCLSFLASSKRAVSSSISFSVRSFFLKALLSAGGRSPK